MSTRKYLSHEEYLKKIAAIAAKMPDDLSYEQSLRYPDIVNLAEVMNMDPRHVYEAVADIKEHS